MKTGSENTLTREQMDAEANQFAMCLLMPEDMVRSEVTKMGLFDFSDDKALKKLADKFKVPQSIMLIRLGQVGLFGGKR